MEGPECPLCGGDTTIIDTANEWPYHCARCGVRFKIVTAGADGVLTFKPEDREIVFFGDTNGRSAAAVIYSELGPVT